MEVSPSRRIRTGVRAEPMCTVISCGSRGGDGGSDSLTSTSLVIFQRPGSTRAVPRAGRPAGMPRRLRATRATPDTDAACSPSDSIPLILAGRMDGVSSSS
jgi:hypothetical protein